MKDSASTPKHAGAKAKSPGGALWVAIGILLSRISGLVREVVFAHFFGASLAGDAYRAAMGIPNALQNLLGEGVLSASFIPVYAQLQAKGEHEDADRAARIVGTVLFFASSVLCLLGIAAAPYLIKFIAPGFEGEKKLLTIQLVRIFFPGIAILVWSAWCLGILNSHRKFFLSYAAPVALNVVMILALIYFGHRADQSTLALYMGWAFVVGAAMQLLVQIPSTTRLLKKYGPSLDYRFLHFQTVLRNFFPVFTSRGVVQLSAYIDRMIASLLPTGAISAINYAQTIYLLPIALFGMSVSAAELPQMASAHGSVEEISAFLKQRLNKGLRQISFVIPSNFAFVVIGDVIISALYQSGQFTHDTTILVWAVLAGSSVGLLAGTQGRLFASAFYALKDTRTPLYFAVLRVVSTTLSGFVGALWVPDALGIDRIWGSAFLTVGFGIAAWIEFLMLRHALSKKIGRLDSLFGYQLRLWSITLVAGAIAWIAHHFTRELGRLPAAALVIGIYGALYLGLCLFFKVPEAVGNFDRIRARLKR